MKNARYWLWVQRVFGYSAWIADPVRYFGSVQALYEAAENDYRASEIFGKSRSFSKSRLVLLTDKSLTFEESVLESCERFGIAIVTPEDADYPKALLRLPDYPAVLFVKGDLSCLRGHLSVAVIGSRNPTEYAKTAAERMTADLASQGVVIVSGGALGIDAIAHKTALKNHQKTVLVMGCGIQSNYLPVNEPLRKAVSQNGALVSEYPPMMQPTAGSFPQRNRMISGMANGVLIVEAGSHSGTLNTASHAKRQNRPLFVLPGDISSAAFAGSNQLIREGAKPVFSAEDLFSHFDMVYALQNVSALQQAEPFPDLAKEERETAPRAPKQASATEPVKKTASTDETPAPAKRKSASARDLLQSVSANAAQVYEIITSGKNQMDEIVLSAALPTAKVLSALTELELFGLICKGEGNYYTVNETDFLL